MKKLLIALIGIVFSVSLFSQEAKLDTVTKQNNPIQLDIGVKSDPISVIISSDDLKKNETLAIVLQQLHEQSLLVDKSLQEFNNTLSFQTKYNQIIDILSENNIDIIEISKNKRAKDILIFIFWTILLIAFNILIDNKALYVDVKMRLQISLFFATLYLVYAFFIIPKIVNMFNLDNYIFENLSNII